MTIVKIAYLRHMIFTISRTALLNFKDNPGWYRMYGIYDIYVMLSQYQMAKKS